jgi:hypothetical protein
MTRPIAAVKDEIKKKFNEISRLEGKIADSEKPPLKLHHELAASKRELILLRREAFGDWLPPSMIKEEDSDG